MKYIKSNIKFFIFVIIVCIIGAYFTTIYSINTIDQAVLDKAVEQVGSKNMVVLITTIQYVLYSIIFTGLGIIISNKVGLWKKININKKGIKFVIVASIIGGITLSIVDRYVFGLFIDSVLHSYDSKPTIEYIIASFTYGGVFEEVLMRLFLMSLIVWIIGKIFYKDFKNIPIKIFVTANIISALLFAASHIPSTIQTFGYIDSLIIFRCFLFNGAFGLMFGYLYRKYGICYSMLAHFGIHLISKIIWLLFI